MDDRATAATILRIPFSETIAPSTEQSPQKDYQKWTAAFQNGFGGGANKTEISDHPYKDDPKLRCIFDNAREAGILYRTYLANGKPEPYSQDRTSDRPRPVAEHSGQQVGQEEHQSIRHMSNSHHIVEQEGQCIGPEEHQSNNDRTTSAPADLALPDSTTNVAIVDISTQYGAKSSGASIETFTDFSKAGRKRDFTYVIDPEDFIDLTGSDGEAASEEIGPAKKRKEE
ncbi:hypothetical protein FLAG1_08427 [Fusarium langsethiae]|uniref:Uncharacterized protein n=2 Tax=Fusarium sambucinum species complex TaxID=569360 RepID=A0A0N0V5S4_FUSLA|nr:hypothetical protein FLAG1_08427 [Fusarium langsethiae]OBS20607.1 hypothetical protein FPOA_06958 [Fusarium poae]GKU05659.1 unnamed protein product [Fusarium langsethiae]